MFDDTSDNWFSVSQNGRDWSVCLYHRKASSLGALVIYGARELPHTVKSLQRKCSGIRRILSVRNPKQLFVSSYDGFSLYYKGFASYYKVKSLET